jgi:DNA-binding beta-propeller fold protein YncE
MSINQYEISYQVTNRERHQLHIEVEGEHIKGSPFGIIAIKKLGTPIKIIDGVEAPWGVAVNQRGEIIVSETSSNCLSIFSSAGEIFRSFGSQGSKQGQFDRIRGVAVDDADNIYVADGNHRIQKFTPNEIFCTAVGTKGSEELQFNFPIGGAFHPLNKKMYVADCNNNRIQILNPDLTFHSSFGSRGGGNGQFNHPTDVAFDSSGNVYVADYYNDFIQVFTEEGEFIRMFGQHGSGSGELHSPSGISIGSNNMVYVTEAINHRISVFTCEGKFLTSFGKSGVGPGELNSPRGIAVDQDGIIYVCDASNNRLQLF